MTDVQSTDVVLDELAAVERDWTRQNYIPFDRRRRTMRYARIGASIETITQRVDGPLAHELKRLIATVDAEPVL